MGVSSGRAHTLDLGSVSHLQMSAMSIATLLQAAEYLDRREREAEHGYATTLPSPGEEEPQRDTTTKNSTRLNKSTKKSGGNRSTHNELEKNRRAHLRSCLENLKDLVPVGADSSRHTTLGLLNKAKHFIKNLEDRDRKSLTARVSLQTQNQTSTTSTLLATAEPAMTTTVAFAVGHRTQATAAWQLLHGATSTLSTPSTRRTSSSTPRRRMARRREVEGKKCFNAPYHQVPSKNSTINSSPSSTFSCSTSSR